MEDLKTYAQQTIDFLSRQTGFISNGIVIAEELGIDKTNVRQVINYLELKQVVKVHYMSDADQLMGLPHYVLLLNDVAL